MARTTPSTTTDRPTTTPSAETGIGTDAPRDLAELGAIAAASTVETAQAAGTPTVQPPGTAAPATVTAAVTAITGTWQLDKRITALWCNQSPRNAWLHVAGIGWRKLSPTQDSSVISMAAIGSTARQTNARVDYVEEADGMISQIVMW
jgi:hypothetical protein